MRVIEKKILPAYFEAVASGKKKFELRLNEFEVSEGDYLLLKEWDNANQRYTGREIKKKVTYVGKYNVEDLFWPEAEIKSKGLLILSID